MPASLHSGFLGRAYGRHIHSLVCLRSERNQNHSTFFLRNRPELKVMCSLLDQKAPGSSVNISVLACSKGAEVYSILWAIRSARPDLKIHTSAIDISPEIVEFAKRGVYSRKAADVQQRRNKYEGDATWMDQSVSIFERLTDAELQAMFDGKGDEARIKPWLKQDITWMTADANDPELARRIGPQDIVVANRFLCHMEPVAAEK